MSSSCTVYMTVTASTWFLDRTRDMSQAYEQGLHYAMIFHSIISLSFAEGTERILRYTSLSYLHRTCITIMSCWCNVCRGLNIERMLSSHSWRKACLISLRFSAYLIRLSYQGVKKLPFFYISYSLLQYSNMAVLSFSMHYWKHKPIWD